MEEVAHKKSIALLPLDNRPVSCLLPKQIADFSGINLILPKRKYLGGLKKGCDLNCMVILILKKKLKGINIKDHSVIIHHKLKLCPRAKYL